MQMKKERVVGSIGGGGMCCRATVVLCKLLLTLVLFVLGMICIFMIQQTQNGNTKRDLISNKATTQLPALLERGQQKQIIQPKLLLSQQQQQQQSATVSSNLKTTNRSQITMVPLRMSANSIQKQIKNNAAVVGKTSRLATKKQTRLQKTKQKTQQQQQITTSNSNKNKGAFVHTGKTGGSTLSVLLRNGCHSFMKHPCRIIEPQQESIVSKMVESYYHVPDFGTLPASEHSFYIITSRDPFDRTVSAFVYEHILNRNARNETIDAIKIPRYEEAYQCFPTLQSYVELLGDFPLNFTYPYRRNWVSAGSCPNLAKAALHSRVKIYNHLYFSYRWILTNIPNRNKQTFYTIRQEHLWDDWKTLNQALGQQGPVYIPDDVDEKNRLRNMSELEMAKKMPVTRELNDEGRKILCKALRLEYEAYFYLLRHAKNLNKNDIQTAIAKTKQNCPHLILPYEKYATTK